jgi:hypothetical protein
MLQRGLRYGLDAGSGKNGTQKGAAGTRALVVGVLQQAIADAVHPDRTVLTARQRAAVRADAVRWVASDATAPSGFRWTCGPRLRPRAAA